MRRRLRGRLRRRMRGWPRLCRLRRNVRNRRQRDDIPATVQNVHRHPVPEHDLGRLAVATDRSGSLLKGATLGRDTRVDARVRSICRRLHSRLVCTERLVVDRSSPVIVATGALESFVVCHRTCGSLRSRVPVQLQDTSVVLGNRKYAVDDRCRCTVNPITEDTVAGIGVVGHIEAIGTLCRCLRRSLRRYLRLLLLAPIPVTVHEEALSRALRLVVTSERTRK
jgi:hypothetical protein